MKGREVLLIHHSGSHTGTFITIIISREIILLNRKCHFFLASFENVKCNRSLDALSVAEIAINSTNP